METKYLSLRAQVAEGTFFMKSPVPNLKLQGCGVKADRIDLGGFQTARYVRLTILQYADDTGPSLQYVGAETIVGQYFQLVNVFDRN